MSNAVLPKTPPAPPEGTPSPASRDVQKLARRQSREHGLFQPSLIKAAFFQSFAMLRPDIQWKNPVMFVVEVGTVLTFVFTIAAATGAVSQVPFGYLLALDFWLFATV